jgi:TusA-related sulfurtransferase
MNTNELTLNGTFDQISKSGTPGYLIDKESDIVLDLDHTKCPVFGLKSMMALRKLERGQKIEIVTFNRSSGKALKRVSWMTGTKMIDFYEEDGQFRYLLRKG